MASLARRVAAKIDRSGEHHIWTGATDGRGAGVMSVDGQSTTARRVVWEREPVPDGAKVMACPEEPGCVRLDHLSLKAPTDRSPATPSKAPKPKTAMIGRRGRSGGGSLRQVRPGAWELTVSAGRYSDGRARRVFRTVETDTERQAVAALASFVAEVTETRQAETAKLRDLTVDEAVDRFLDEHLRAEKGREEKTIADYRRLHLKWFSPNIGKRRLRDIDEARIDRIFGAMRAAGLSRSRLNQAKCLYSPLFRWAKRRGIVSHNPMLEFQLPTTRHVTKERTPPEVEELCLLLSTAVDVVPAVDVAPVLALGAVTGMRRGELVAIRSSRIDWSEGRIRVDAAVSETKQMKGTKTRVERSFHVDAETLTMLVGHVRQMEERAAAGGATLDLDPFLFSLALDCSTPMPPDYVTRRTAILKEHLGIDDIRPETAASEEEALRLYRQRPARPSRRTGPPPKGGLSFRDIGAALEGATAGRPRPSVRPSAGKQPERPIPPFAGSAGPSSPCVASPQTSCSTPASTSPWSPSARATAPACSPAITPSRAGQPTVGPPTISGRWCTAGRQRKPSEVSELEAAPLLCL